MLRAHHSADPNWGHSELEVQSGRKKTTGLFLIGLGKDENYCYQCVAVVVEKKPLNGCLSVWTTSDSYYSVVVSCANRPVCGVQLFGRARLQGDG